MPDPHYRTRLYEEFARVAKAAGHGHRLSLLEFLAQGERSVEALAQVAGITIANTSQHLRILREAGLVEGRKVGAWVLYRLSDPGVVELLAVVRGLAERRLATVEQLVASCLGSRDGLEPVEAAELLDRLREGSVTVLDVRPEEEFCLGHLPGAVNIPLPQLEAQLSRLPPDREVVAYCRGPYCLLAAEAVSRLRQSGFTAHRLRQGLPEWRLLGYPVEIRS